MLNKKTIFSKECDLIKSDSLEVKVFSTGSYIAISTDGDFPKLRRSIIFSRDEAVEMAIKILDAATNSEEKFSSSTDFGRVVYQGTVVGTDKVVTGSLLQFKDGTCTILHHETNAEDKGFTSPVIPESIKCISHCIDDFNKITFHASDIGVILDRKRANMLIADQFTNEDRSRRYGLRPGDIVKNSRGVVFEVINLNGMDNNRVYVSPIGAEGSEPVPHVAESLEIITKVEDRE